MRKLVLLTGLLTAAMFVPGTPARAEAMLGCSCVKMGAAPVCRANIAECTQQGGLCLAPCSYEPPKKMAKQKRGKKKKM